MLIFQGVITKPCIQHPKLPNCPWINKVKGLSNALKHSPRHRVPQRPSPNRNLSTRIGEGRWLVMGNPWGNLESVSRKLMKCTTNIHHQFITHAQLEIPPKKNITSRCLSPKVRALPNDVTLILWFFSHCKLRAHLWFQGALIQHKSMSHGWTVEPHGTSEGEDIKILTHFW